MKFPSKREVLNALIDALSDVVHATTTAAEDVRRSAIHEEARPENDKDTRALEQTYLARGQAMRAEVMVEQVQLLRSMLSDNLSSSIIAAGSLIELEDEAGATRCLFLAPYGGGQSLSVGGVTIVVVTPSSALGRALLGKQEGDDFALRTRDSSREYTILTVR